MSAVLSLCIFTLLNTEPAQAASTQLNPDFINDGLVLNQVTPTADGIQELINASGDGNVAKHALIGPVTMKFVPGANSILVVEKQGRVRQVDYDVSADGRYENFRILPDPVLDISDITSSSVDRGLLGLAIDPNYASNGYIYLGYTYENDPSKPSFALDASIEGCENETEATAPDRCTQLAPKTARVSRFTVSGGSASRSSETVLVGSVVGSPSQPSCSAFNNGINVDCIFADSGSHAAPSLDFFLDGSLAVFTGDGAGFYQAEEQAFRSMYLDNYSGKVLRINPSTGAGYSDNPFFSGNAQDVQSKIWASGLRNPYGLQIIDTGNSAIGEPIGGMVGWNQVESILHVSRGSFMGWPCFSFETTVTNYKFLCEDLNAQRPQNLAGTDLPTKPGALIYRHQEVNNYASAVAGGAFLESSDYGSLAGQYIFADYRLGQTFKGSFSNNFETLTVPRQAPGGDNAPMVPFAQGGLIAPVAFITAPNGIVYIVDIFAGRFDGFNFGSIVELGVGGDTPSESTAEITISTSSTNPLARSFECGQSFVHTGEQANCVWDYGDGNTETVSIDTETTHLYSSPGTYNVTLTLQTIDGDVLATASQELVVTDLTDTTLPIPILEEAIFPNNDTAISQSFDVITRVRNIGANQPFYMVLKARDQNGQEVSSVETSIFVSSLENDGFLEETFENLVITQEGLYDFFISYIYADTNGLALGESEAQSAGQMVIFDRAGGGPVTPTDCFDAPPLGDNKGWDGETNCHVNGEPWVPGISDQPGYQPGDTAPNPVEPTNPVEPVEPINPVEPVDEIKIFEEALNAPWASWSWNISDLQVIQSVDASGSTSNVMQTTYLAPYGGIYLRTTSPITLDSTKSVQFAIRAQQGNVNNNLTIALYDAADQEIEQLLINDYVSLVNDQWVIVNIPVSDFMEGDFQMTGIVLQDNTGIAGETFSFDNILISNWN